MGLEPIVIEMEAGVSVDRVWRAWTEPDELTAWLTMKANVRAEPGGPYELFWDPEHPEHNSTLGCTILSIEALRHLTFSWKGPMHLASLMNREPLPTSVTVTLEARGPRLTQFTLRHSGWGDGPAWVEARAWQDNAWRGALGALMTRFEM